MKRIIAGILLGFCVSTQAVDWDDGAADHNWSSALNWNTDVVPISGQSGYMITAEAASPTHPVIQAGDVVRLDDSSKVRAVEAIPRGSKLALGPIACGEAVVRYGEEIGRATRDIAAGEYVHTHNLARER